MTCRLYPDDARRRLLESNRHPSIHQPGSTTVPRDEPSIWIRHAALVYGAKTRFPRNRVVRCSRGSHFAFLHLIPSLSPIARLSRSEDTCCEYGSQGRIARCIRRPQWQGSGCRGATRSARSKEQEQSRRRDWSEAQPQGPLAAAKEESKEGLLCLSARPSNLR